MLIRSRKISSVLAALLGVAAVNAQCDLVISSFQVSTSCPSLQPVADVSYSGGTPPFQIHVVTDLGVLTNLTTSEPHYQPFELEESNNNPSSGTLTITDAEGCTDDAFTGWVATMASEPVLSYSETCDGLLYVNWHEAFYWEGECVMPGPWYYHFDYGPESTLAEGWSQISPGHWQIVLPRHAAPSSIMIFKDDEWHGYTSNLNICHGPRFLAHDNIPWPIGCGARFRLRAALAGPSIVWSLMSDDLRSLGLLPAQEPYSAMGYTYVGGSGGVSIAPSVMAGTGANAVVDWVVVEVRSATVPTTVLWSMPALLQRDGDVVNPNGGTVMSTGLPTGQYHVAIRHRNHLGVMTATPRFLNETASMLDFTLPGTATFGINAQVNVNGMMAMACGDSDGSGTVSYTGSGNDRDVVLVAIGGVVPTNALTNVYDRRDVNLDGRVMYTGTANDRDVILQSIGGTVPTATRTQQLP